MLALLLSVLGATDPDGGVDFKAPLYSQCSEAPPVERVDGGVFMSYPREQRVACRMATCERDRRGKARRLEQQRPPPAWWLWVSGLVAAAALGFALRTWLPL